jgi:membrane peptidoglycan carboxypeptidase
MSSVPPREKNPRPGGDRPDPEAVDGWFRPEGTQGLPARTGSTGVPRARTVGTGRATVPVPTRRRRSRVRRVVVSLLVVAALGVAVLVVAYLRTAIPDANASALRQTSRVFYAGGTVEVGRFGDTNRSIVSLDKVPMPLRDAVLAAENRDFYTDNGVSPKGIARALWVNLRGGSTQGGSTITQQYVKNYYLTQDRTITRKVREALLSIKIDKVMTKDQILEDYLNTIYLGRGAYGMQAAARAYFDKDVGALDVSQSAALAGIIQSPGRFDPADPAGLTALKGRWTYVVDAMVKTGTLTRVERDGLTFPTFPAVATSQSRFGGQRGYLLNAISKELQDRGLTKDEIENGGLQIITTLDPQAQKSAVDAVTGEFPKTKNAGLRVGLVAVQPKTGRILAMYGGKDFLGKGRYAQVNTATVPIQPGSGMKPFALAAALENGYTLDSTFNGNSPLPLPGGRPVSNEFNRSYGPAVSLFTGLEQSVNTVFVDLTRRIGPANVRDAMVRAGIPADAPGLANNALIPLGIASIRPTEVADAYATLCGEGIHAEQHMVERVLGANGGEVPIRRPAVSVDPVFSPAVVSDVIRAMENVVQRGTGTKALALGRPAAGKTGTHQSLTAWFNGCTPQLAASVDYFKGDGTASLDGSAGMSTFFGGTYPAQTWTTFMRGALKGLPVEQFPPVQGVTPIQPAAPAETRSDAQNPPDTHSRPQAPAPGVPAPAPPAEPLLPIFAPPPAAEASGPTPNPAPPAAEPPSDGAGTPAPPANCTDDPNDPDPAKTFSPFCPPAGSGGNTGRP